MELEKSVWGLRWDQELSVCWWCHLLPMRVPRGCFTRHFRNEGTWEKKNSHQRVDPLLSAHSLLYPKLTLTRFLSEPGLQSSLARRGLLLWAFVLLNLNQGFYKHPGFLPLWFP